jgi:hypothetical protein
MGLIQNCLGEMQKRAKTKFSEIQNKEVLWDFIFENDLTEFI